MRIAIDISQIIFGTGVSTYTKNLIQNLIKIDQDNEYFLFGFSLRRKAELEIFAKQFEGRVASRFFTMPPSVSEFFANQIHFPKLENIIGKIDVYHSSDWAQFASNSFKVTTVHDLAPIFYPKLTNRKIREVHKRRLNWIVREADQIIVPSNSTKNDLIKIGALVSKISVIPEALDPAFTISNSNEIEEVKKKYRILGRYILGVGVNLRKNTDGLIEAFSKAKSDDLKLILTGYPYSKKDESRGVSYIGHVPTSDLASLYSGAECLVYPSFYEGFGLPILEAFATGCPVVTSNVSSMPEVAGNAAILVDPHDTTSIASGIKKALKSRIGLSKKGFKQLEKFSWEDNARETLKIYELARI